MGKENNNYINGYVRNQNNHPISFDTEGNLVDQISGEKGTMMLPGFTVTGISPETKAKNYSTSFDGTYGLTPRDIYGMMPVVGDALDIKDIGTDLYNGNYINAGIGAGLFLLPNVIEKPFKFTKSLYKGYKTNKIMKAARKAFDKSGEKLEVDAFKSKSKPMYVTPSKGPGSDHINIISDELKDSKYFDLERPFGKDKTQTLRYYINEGKLKQIIGTYKDFYKDRLGLHTNDVDKIYNYIISNPKLLDLNINSGTTGLQDIIGVSLGYGPKDAILFKIGYNGLNTGEKVSKDAIESLKVYNYDKTLPGIYNILKKNIERGTLGVKSTTINGGHVGFGYVKNKFGGKFIKLIKQKH